MLPQLKITAAKSARCPVSLYSSLSLSFCLPLSLSLSVPFSLPPFLCLPLSLFPCFGHLPSRIYRLNLIPTYVYVIFETATLIERLKTNQQLSWAEQGRAGQKLQISVSQITFGQPQAMAKWGIFIYSNGNIKYNRFHANILLWLFDANFFNLSYLCQVFLFFPLSLPQIHQFLNRIMPLPEVLCAWRMTRQFFNKNSSLKSKTIDHIN